jgi:integrase
MEPEPMTTSSARQVLTDRYLRSLVPGRTPKDYSDLHQRGLIAWLLPSGTIQFVVRYRWQGKNRRHKLGDYSDVFTLAKARKAARAALTKVDAGLDPAGALQAAKRAPVAGATWADLTADYIERHAKRKKRSWKDDERMLTAEIPASWQTRPVTAITRRDVRDLVEAIAERGSPITANRCLALVRKILNFAIERDWIDANPASLIAKPGAEVSRERVLTDDEIRKLWRCLTRLPTTVEQAAPGRRRAHGTKDDPICPISPSQAALLKLRLLTAQRGGEVARMRWQDLDLAAGWWTVPSEHAKNKQAHRVPLVGRALDIVKAQQPKKEDQDMTSHTVPDRATGDDRAVFVFSGGETGAQDRAKKAPAIVGKAIGIDFRGHDLRRTAATKMAEAGIGQSDIAKVLNHAEGGPRATQDYNRYEPDREKRIALETWDRTLTRILESTPAATVTPITARKRKA